jgi:predicted nucleotidyltransferase
VIDLRPEHLALVREILQRRVPSAEVWVFGSRVQGTAKPHSDLDLAIISDAPLEGALLAELAEDFSDSDLPMRVDLVDWATTSERFREIIRNNYAVIQPE